MRKFWAILGASISFLLISLFTSGTVNAQEQIVEKTVNTADGYEIMLPMGWYGKMDSDANILAVPCIQTPDNTSCDQLVYLTTVDAFPTNSLPVDSLPPECIKTPSQSVTINGLNAKEGVNECTGPDGMPLKLKADVISIGTKYLVAIYFSTAAGYNDYVSAFDIALQTLEMGSPVDTSKTNELIKKGDQLVAQLKYAEAISAYDQALKIDPKNVVALIQKGIALDKQLKYEDAISHFDKALSLDKNNSKALLQKGIALYHFAKYDDSILLFDKVLAIDQNNAKALYYKGLAFVILGKYAESLPFFDKSIAIDPSNEVSLTGRGVAYMQLHRYEDSKADYQAALQVNPKYTIALYNMGLLLHSKEKFDEAISYYDKALAIDPQYQLASSNREKAVNHITVRIEGTEYHKEKETAVSIPSWIKNNAKWWSDGQISDDDFVKGIQYMIQNKIMKIPATQTGAESQGQSIPSWIKNNAKWWSDGQISDDDFVKGIQYLVEQGIIKA